MCGRQRERAHDGHQRLRHRMLRRAVEGARDLLPPPRELGVRDAGVGDLVDDIVDFAAERIERGDRAPALAGAGRGSCSRSSSRFARPSAGSIRRASCGVRRRAGDPSARQATAHQSRARSTGRLREHVALRGIDAREDAEAALDHRRQLEAERAAAARASAGARIRASFARAATSKAMSARQRASAWPSRDLRGGHAEAMRDPPAEGRRGSCASRRATSCQKLVSCRPVQIASLCMPLRAIRHAVECSSSRPTGLAERRQ